MHGKDKPRIYLGKSRTANRTFAKRLLKAFGIGNEKFVDVYANEGRQSALRHLTGNNADLDLAIVISGVPTEGVDEQVFAGCRLVPLGREAQADFIGAPNDLPADTYEKQPRSVATFADPVYLVARRDLPNGVVAKILRTLYENLDSLIAAHPAARGICFPDKDVEDLAVGLAWHPGVALYRTQRKQNLAIATGPLDGQYFQMGQTLQSALKERGVDALLLPTDGSLENLDLLDQDRPAVAFLQYDVALASFAYSSRAVYRNRIAHLPGESADSTDIRKVRTIKRIASLRDEVLYVLANKSHMPPVASAAPDRGKNDPARRTAVPPLSEWLKNSDLRVGIGPARSGTYSLGRAVLGNNFLALEPTLGNEPVDTMLRRLERGGLDLVFVVTSPKTTDVNEALYNDKIAAVPIDNAIIADLRGPALERYSLSPDDLAAGIPEIDTLKTRAVIVANEFVSHHDVEQITASVIDKFEQMNDGERGDEKRLLDLAIQSPGIPLHPAAEAVYKKAKILPSIDFSWLNWTNSLIGLCIALPTLITILAGIWPRVVSASVDRRIAKIDFEHEPASRIEKLRRLQEQLLFALTTKLTNRQAWKLLWFRLSPAKWRESDALIERRIEAARDKCTRNFAEKIHALDQMPPDGAATDEVAEMRPPCGWPSSTANSIVDNTNSSAD